MEGLTPRQEQVLEFIRESVRANGYPPTVREICSGLEPVLAIDRARAPRQSRASGAHQARSHEAAGARRGAGYPAAAATAARRAGRGRPADLAEDNIEDMVDVPAFLRRDDGDFVLRIDGDSMIEAGILNGDLVVVHPQQQAANGEIVVARVDDEATTKRFFSEGRTIRLQPENDNYEPIIVNADEFELVGRVVGVLRQL